jgi:DNA-binding transcriptional LysR family regulator
VLAAGVEMRDIETVLVLAEELHFGRTAERLKVSTARVSQVVQAVERRIGAPLFERTSRRVGLTPLGKSLVAELRPVVAALDRVIGTAKDRSRTTRTAVSIGHSVTVNDVPELDALISAFESRCANRRVLRLRFDNFTYFQSMVRGELDLWITWWPGAFPTEEEGLRGGPPIALRDPVLLVGRRHPLATRTSVVLDDLAVHPVLAMPSTQPALFRKWWVPRTAPNGRPIATVDGSWSVGTFQELAWHLEPGDLGWFTAARTPERMAMPPGVVAVPVRDAAPFALLPLWRPAAETPAMREFIDAISWPARTDQPAVSAVPGGAC